MSESLSKYVLRLFFVSKTQEVFAATALPLGNGLVLTTSHVFQNQPFSSDWKIVLELYDGSQQERLDYSNQVVVFQGGDDEDIALLATKRYDYLGRPFTVATHADEVRRNRRVYGLAFPNFEQGQNEAKLFYLDGRLADQTHNRALQQLTVEQHIIEPQSWKGASGTPLIDQGRIVGVLKAKPNATINTLHYCSVGFVFENSPEFAAHFKQTENVELLNCKINENVRSYLETIDSVFLAELAKKLKFDSRLETYQIISKVLKYSDISNLLRHTFTCLKLAQFSSQKLAICKPLVLAFRWLVLNDLTVQQKEALLEQTGLLDVSAFSFITRLDYVEVAASAQCLRGVDFQHENGKLTLTTDRGANIENYLAFDASSPAIVEDYITRFLYIWFVERIRSASENYSNDCPDTALADIKRELVLEFGTDQECLEEKNFTYFYLSQENANQWATKQWFVSLQCDLAPQLRFFFIPKDETNLNVADNQSDLLDRFRFLLQFETEFAQGQ